MSAVERGVHWEGEGCLYVDKRGAWPKLETTQYDNMPQVDYCLELIETAFNVGYASNTSPHEMETLFPTTGLK